MQAEPGHPLGSSPASRPQGSADSRTRWASRSAAVRRRARRLRPHRQLRVQRRGERRRVRDRTRNALIDPQYGVTVPADCDVVRGVGGDRVGRGEGDRRGARDGHHDRRRRRTGAMPVPRGVAQREPSAQRQRPRRGRRPWPPDSAASRPVPMTDAVIPSSTSAIGPLGVMAVRLLARRRVPLRVLEAAAISRCRRRRDTSPPTSRTSAAILIRAAFAVTVNRPASAAIGACRPALIAGTTAAASPAPQTEARDRHERAPRDLPRREDRVRQHVSHSGLAPNTAMAAIASPPPAPSRPGEQTLHQDDPPDVAPAYRRRP